MPSPYPETMPNGTPAIFATLPPEWQRLLRRKVALDEQDGPAIADRVVKPEWASNSNPVEISAPYATQGPLVQGRDPGEMVVARGGGNAAPQEPIRPMPVLRPDPNQPVTDAGPSVNVAPPETSPIVLPRDFSFVTPKNAPTFDSGSQPLPQIPVEARQAQVAVRDPNSREGLQSQIEWELAHPAKAGHRSFKRKALDEVLAFGAGMGMAPPGSSLAERFGAGGGYAIAEAARPDTIYEQRQRGKVGQLSQRLGTLNAIQDEQDKRVARRATAEKTVADTNEANARADSLRNPKPTTFKGADGLQYEYDASTHTAKPIAGQGRARAKVLRTVERSGKVWYETDEGLQPALDPQTGKQLEEELIPVTLPGGATVKVKPATAAQLSSTFANRRATAQEQEAFKQYGASLKAVRDRNRVKERDYTQAVKAGEDFNKRHDDLDKMYADAQSLSEKIKNSVNDDPEAAQKLSALNGQLPGLQARLNAEAKRLTEQYGQHLRYNEQERFEPLSSGPELEDDPDLPALNVGEGPQVGVSRAPQVINAQAYAKDHKISVEEARKLINATPGYTAGN